LENPANASTARTNPIIWIVLGSWDTRPFSSARSIFSPAKSVFSPAKFGFDLPRPLVHARQHRLEPGQDGPYILEVGFKASYAGFHITT